MMKKVVVLWWVIASVLTPGVSLADARASEVEALMRDYLKMWNAGDAAGITANIYRFDAPNPLGTTEGLQAEFKRLKSQGYDHSIASAIDGCLLTESTAIVNLRYQRLKTDGSAMPPADRSTLYLLRKTKEGWRVTQLIPTDASAKLQCTSFSNTKN